jgi:type IV pilus assembly protein PilY1
MNVDSFNDSTSEDTVKAVVQWEYPRADVANDGMNNDGDGLTDESGETDPDIGYSFSQAYVVKTNDPSNEWVVIFGNGYNSDNGSAVLYVLDLNGVIVRKLNTGVTGGNGLSTPALIDVNNDRKLDYVYVGDLKGNMWKFDFTADTAANWAVAFNDGTDPKPLFAAGVSQPITAKPDIMRHCGYDKSGYMVIFGTGKYLHNDDRINTDQQTIYGIWDYGDDDDDDEYVGSSLDHSTGQIGSPGADIAGTYLLKQTVVDIRDITSYGTYRTFSDEAANWAVATDSDTDQKPDPVSGSDVGWFIDFPNAAPYEGERVFKTVQIRDGKAFVISFFPDSSPCSGGGNSWFYIIDACDGGRMPDSNAQWEIGVAEGQQTGVNDSSGNEIITKKNTVVIVEDGNNKLAAPTGKLFKGTLHEPKIIRKPGTGLERLYMSSSTGVVETEDVPAERRGTLYWLER